MNEITDNKRERFLRLAQYRTNEVLKKIRILGNCANRSAYEYDDMEVRKIFNEIEQVTKETKAKFIYKKKSGSFHL